MSGIKCRPNAWARKRRPGRRGWAGDRACKVAETLSPLLLLYLSPGQLLSAEPSLRAP